MTEQRMSLRNVGIFAHVDAGKTTTTEQILYRSGRIRSLGNVDDGTAQTDWLEVERTRGISVRSAVTRFQWKDVQVNLVDTPGHVDFLSEVERSLRVMDGAVLIVSAVEGVQAQTEVIWQALRDLGIPTIIYLNKMDRIGAEPDRVVGEIHRLLSAGAVPIQAFDGVEGEFSGSTDLLTGDDKSSLRTTEDRRRLAEKIAEMDDALLELYFERGELADTDLIPVLRNSIREANLFPVLFGASNRGIGVERLMDAIVDLLPPPAGDESSPLSGVVFKLDKDPVMGRLAYVRLYGGALRNRDTVRNHALEIDEKVTQIRKMDGQRSEDIGILKAGDIAVVCGWSRVRIGDIIGDRAGVPGERRIAEPLLTVQANWRNEAEYPAVVAAFQELADEDPHLDVQWLQEDRELHLRVMGPIQVEVLGHMLMNRYGLEVTFGAPSVIYKETPVSKAEGFVAYTMPKPCWAILRFVIEPDTRGNGLSYRSIVRTENLLERYQNEVARRVPEALEQGLRGWPVTDLKVTLAEGEHHVWHTHPLDFVVATPMGIMDGLANAKTKLLEPMLRFRLSTPEEYGGKIMSELVVMRGEFDTPKVRQGRMEIEGRLPVATSLDFPARLGSMTKGRGMLTTFFDGYQDAPSDVNAERTRRGVNPLDTSKYILATRSALT
ncbi:GTP-binding protein [Cohnella cholangitidis]|uniref:TetM/TetW/TetO/TetS family tetracycline resistance ribosomal protection protein n=1 Tax=Cohnella cholangitidis TaxID=2598458 RepID=A0A7G5C2F8_9BACL|nr:TetM/TetW/TetO/TetS family tetracycline resistance ribosomal protection protein [Cohnella cholangitidis]QMV43392.1 TetM/TetW/TetO/TetS family tetracycline resistance ribosomal protection protein [Cohnella cholangitidis]